MSDEEVKKVLKAEYWLLCLCNAFKNAFDGLACSSGVTTIPEFYFNFEASIFGKVIPTPASGSCPLPHKYFLATPLLPCRPHDATVQKFTGNGTIGTADDHLTKAIHAFAHFSLVYSSHDILLCDLQGAPDRKGRMCLIHPQCHTYVPRSLI
ncbi:uncharacterized protein LACBIDRAFT_312494 [Laccaria bicolor S238N-H82]|uniref:Predicted protein n=1 Tax=Laccaria bicolor (strain S238N-H82 / ATCC MYA-4686) TaxID=486041 RepID=B0DWA7_LACBS|nr:uncharacterized protein LACBIDRAFT_312494 [Laccaria bicolor S238N-H82]EDR01156.1 predicted protein [Laccaria bicolor S238N-H82]|eukprot:XP_001888198.1 predicted protein [Laccaria bicolor S238N-H82]